jgi:dienelactone hydrolase
MKDMKQVICLIMMSFFMMIFFTGCIQENQEQQPPIPTLEEVAVDIVEMLMKNNLAGVYNSFDDSLQSQLTANEFEGIWEQQVTYSYGSITNIIQTQLTNDSMYSVVLVTCNFSKAGKFDVKISFTDEQKIVSLLVVPSQEVFPYHPPTYVNLSSFTEEETTIGVEPWVLPATVSIPSGTGPFPAVVLVHGSGPNDRDETYGPNKPFKDLAWGLASRGIVVLRYEKRTKMYPTESAALRNLTVQDETIDDALAAVDVLQNFSFVNDSQMFVLGHSLGGMLAPRIAVQDDRIAGLIILAGPTRHLEDLILEQTRYLANQSGVNQSEQIEDLERLVNKIKNLDINNSEVVLGAPRSYWVDLATYNPVETAQSLHLPLLILQGERDYQVTMVDFARWNETFFDNASVVLKTYPSLNHFFMTGTGAPTNTEYLIESHVAEEVINDIVSWITEV